MTVYVASENNLFKQALLSLLKADFQAEEFSPDSSLNETDILISDGEKEDKPYPPLTVFLTKELNDNDTFLKKPFYYRDLQKILWNKKESAVSFAGFLLFPKTKELILPSGEKENLTEKETALLQFLHQRKDIVSKEEILQHIWHYDADISTHTLETHIYKLRRKMKNDNVLKNMDNGYFLADK